MTRPLVVAETPEAFASAVRGLRRTGATTAADWRGRPGIVCVGAVESEEDAAAAVLAAVRGAGVVVEGRAPREVLDRLVDDLRRLGDVDHLLESRGDAPILTREEQAVLDLLGEGLTLGDAAKELGIARRTADRRLASAREKLGVASTAAAVVAARKL